MTTATRTGEPPVAIAQPDFAPGRAELTFAYPRQLAGLAFFFGGALCLSAAAVAVSGLGLGRDQPAGWQTTVSWLFRLWARTGRLLKVIEIGIRNREVLEGLSGTVVAANHPSLVDAFALLTAVPRGVCVMRSDLTRNPALGPLACLAGYIPNDSGPALVRGGIARVLRGDNLIVFPEGTRSPKGGLRRFRRGFALVAQKAGVPVQTVHLRFQGELFRKGHGLLVPARLPVRLDIEPGERFRAERGEAAEALGARIEAYFRSRLDS